MNSRGITYLVFSAFLILVSIQLCRGKWFGLIAGYNTLPGEARKDVDIWPYARRISALCFPLGLLFLALAFEKWLQAMSSPAFDIVLGVLAVLAAVSFLRLVKFIFLDSH